MTERKIFYCNDVWPQYLLGSPQGVQAGLPWDPVHHVLSPLLCQVRRLWSPVLLVWIQQLSKESHCLGLKLMFLVICKTPRPNLRVCLGFSVCFSGFSFHFVLVLFLYLQTDVNGGKEQQQKTCLFLSESGIFSGTKSFHWVPKITIPKFSLVGSCQGKRAFF